MKIFVLLFVALITLTLTRGATKPKERHYTLPNTAFFFANNDDFDEMLQAVSMVLCQQDRVVDDSTGAWLMAAKECDDSKHNADGESLNQDGKWHGYVWQAVDAIKTMCERGSGSVCESLR